MSKDQGPLLKAPNLRGSEFAAAHSAAADSWFTDLVAEVLSDPSGIALVAVGGYGRRMLYPESDVDVVLLHGDSVNGAEIAEALWYPVWDRGLSMGYVVVTLAQAEQLIMEEFEWATSFLDARLIAGSEKLCAELTGMVQRVWSDNEPELMARLASSVEGRHSKCGDAAFQIEPDLKDGRGGLRDIHAMAWAEQAIPGFAADFLDQLSSETETLVRARVELHRAAGRNQNVLSLDDQDGVAEALGDTDSQPLMLRLALAARRIGWCSEEAWRRWRSSSQITFVTSAVLEEAVGHSESDEERGSLHGPLAVRNTQFEEAFSSEDIKLFKVVDGSIAINDEVDAQDYPLVLLKLAVIAARTRLVMNRESLARIKEARNFMPEPWPAEARTLFAALFLEGRAAISVIEDLNHFGLFKRFLPEWRDVICHPQRNVLHTFTVDRHLCESAVNAATLAERVQRPDLLVVGALLHDIGKGSVGDHTEVGIEIIGRVTARMGYPKEDAKILADLCRHHLLLPDVATRRDLSDVGTIESVAEACGSVEFLHLLAALTEADSIATGPSAWGSWKAGLLRELVVRTEDFFEGSERGELTGEDFPPSDVVTMMRKGKRQFVWTGGTLTVVASRQSNLLSILAGVVAVCGIEVLAVSAFTDDAHQAAKPMTACRFVLKKPAMGKVNKEKVEAMTVEAIEGKVALRARVSHRAREYSRYRKRLSAEPPRTDVVIDNTISGLATVVEVHSPEQIGLLYRLTRVLLEVNLEIRKAKLQVFGPQAVASFYLCDSEGAKVEDKVVLDELRFGLAEEVSALLTV